MPHTRIGIPQQLSRQFHSPEPRGSRQILDPCTTPDKRFRDAPKSANTSTNPTINPASAGWQLETNIGISRNSYQCAIWS